MNVIRLDHFLDTFFLGNPQSFCFILDYVISLYFTISLGAPNKRGFPHRIFRITGLDKLFGDGLLETGEHPKYWQSGDRR
jgi:hypothetical protein